MPDRDRIAARLDALWQIALGPAGGADRPAYSAAEAEAVRMVAGWAAEQDLEPGLDPYGNLWALPPGDGSVVTAGSHVDTVPDGGRYDGALGTVLGLEIARDLAADGIAAGVLVCAAEEAPRFGAGTVGSRQLVGTVDDSDLEAMRDARGVTAAEAREQYLAALADLPRVAPAPERVRAHCEIHVAQRPELRELGVVTRVASPRRFELRIEGEAGHSGEVAMEARRDALAAAAEVILAVEAAARAEPPATVATVGTLEVSPGAVSVIPGAVRLAIDVRGVDAASLDHVEAVIREGVAIICERRDVAGHLKLTRAGEPVALDADLVAAALATAERLGVPARATWSGAGHDAQHLAAIIRALLLFVPLHGGASHTPQEGADMDEIVQATAVAVATLAAPGA